MNCLSIHFLFEIVFVHLILFVIQYICLLFCKYIAFLLVEKFFSAFLLNFIRSKALLFLAIK
jgi:biopolymer transport protein ExbB/TolQ